MWQLTKAMAKMKFEHWTKRWNWSSCTKLALSTSWTHCLIAQSVRVSEWNSVVMGQISLRPTFFSHFKESFSGEYIYIYIYIYIIYIYILYIRYIYYILKCMYVYYIWDFPWKVEVVQYISHIKNHCYVVLVLHMLRNLCLLLNYIRYCSN